MSLQWRAAFRSTAGQAQSTGAAEARHPSLLLQHLRMDSRLRNSQAPFAKLPPVMESVPALLGAPPSSLGAPHSSQPAKSRNPSTACQEKSSTLTTATAGQKCHARMWVRGALLPRIQHIYLSLQKTNTVRRGTAAVSLRGPTQGRGTHEACSGEEAAPGPNPANPHCQLHEWLLSPLQQPAGSSGHRQAAG